MPKSSAVEASNDHIKPLDVEIPGFVFRPIHYLGSKLRVLPSIRQAIDRVDPSGGPVCDLFSGSATVSRYFSQSRRVLAVDIQEYARVLADAVLNGAPACIAEHFDSGLAEVSYGTDLRHAVEPLVDIEVEFALKASRGDIEPLCEILDLGNLASLEHASLPVLPKLRGAVNETLRRIEALGLRGEDTVCIRHFGGQYFSYAQAAELDALAAMAHKTKSSVALAAVLSTASQLVNSIGKQFAQPIRPRDKFGAPKWHVVKKILMERGLSAPTIFMGYLRQYEGLATKRRDHVAMRADFREALACPAIKPSVVYADPPYTRDHYSRFYHSLETIALGDEPSITTSNLGGGSVKSRGGYRAGRHQSPFCIKSEAPKAFSSLFAGVAELGVPLVLSYSGFDPSMEARPRVMALDAVVGLAKRHFREVNVELLTDLEHIKLNSSSLNKAAKGTTEVLLLCR